MLGLLELVRALLPHSCNRTMHQERGVLNTAAFGGRRQTGLRSVFDKYFDNYQCRNHSDMDALDMCYAVRERTMKLRCGLQKLGNLGARKNGFTNYMLKELAYLDRTSFDLEAYIQQRKGRCAHA